MKKVAVYIRLGSESFGFILPDEREAFRAFMNRAETAEANREPDQNELTEGDLRYEPYIHQ